MSAFKGCLLNPGPFKPGDPMPDGYMARAEWARVQMRAGYRQTYCKRCERWEFQQQKHTKRGAK